MRFPVGTKFATRSRDAGVHILHTVTNFHTTRNLAGEIVRARYVATHQFMGQDVEVTDIPQLTVAIGVDTFEKLGLK